jgi:hypothetical protein
MGAKLGELILLHEDPPFPEYAKKGFGSVLTLFEGYAKFIFPDEPPK